MILLIILAIIMAILLVFTIAVVSVGGAVGIILFGDVIVCILVIGAVIKKLIFKK